MQTIQEKLDLLAEFHAQKDLLELDKKKLLEDVKIPAEIKQIVSDGMKMAQRIELDARVRIAAYEKTIDAELAAVSIPAELKAALAELRIKEAILMSQFADVEKQRQEIAAQKKSNEAVELEHLKEDRAQLEEEIKAKTAKVYADIEQRRNEIEAEFSGKAGDVESNIKKLEAEIKEEVKAGKKSVKGQFFHAIYVSGRITWNTEKMEAWRVDHPFLDAARKEGEPSITLRRI
jgi:hypothetical protein